MAIEGDFRASASLVIQPGGLLQGSGCGTRGAIADFFIFRDVRYAAVSDAVLALCESCGPAFQFGFPEIALALRVQPDGGSDRGLPLGALGLRTANRRRFSLSVPD